jgi:hypothetical protein
MDFCDDTAAPGAAGGGTTRYVGMEGRCRRHYRLSDRL